MGEKPVTWPSLVAPRQLPDEAIFSSTCSRSLLGMVHTYVTFGLQLCSPTWVLPGFF